MGFDYLMLIDLGSLSLDLLFGSLAGLRLGMLALGMTERLNCANTYAKNLEAKFGKCSLFWVWGNNESFYVGLVLRALFCELRRASLNAYVRIIASINRF